MKIVLVSREDVHGGAAISCFRLLNALNNNGIAAKSLVQKKSSESEFVETTTKSFFKKLLNFYRFVFERLIFLLYEKSKEVRFAFNLGNTGENINNNLLIKEADLINLHWINMGFLSIKSIERIIKLNKPVVWTLHDMWAFTGGCHYAGECGNFKLNCGNCPFLKTPSKFDLSYNIHRKKLEILFKGNQKKIVFVASSNWLCEEARKSSLLKGYRIESIPIPVNTELFRPLDKQSVRKKYELENDRFFVLFAAMNINDKRKGFAYFLESLKIIKEKYPDLSNKLSLIVFGKSNEETLSQLPFPVKNFHFIRSQETITEIFSASDLFVIPSLEDNLPNIIMESLACGTPVVSFNTGGIPQMIDHLNTGYVADYKSPDDLANGINWCLTEADKQLISEQSRTKALKCFSEKVVVDQYSKLYKELINVNSLY